MYWFAATFITRRGTLQNARQRPWLSAASVERCVSMGTRADAMRAWHVNSTDHQYPLITAAKSIIGAPPSLSNHCRGVLRCNFLLWAFVAAKRRNAQTALLHGALKPARELAERCRHALAVWRRAARIASGRASLVVAFRCFVCLNLWRRRVARRRELDGIATSASIKRGMAIILGHGERKRSEVERQSHPIAHPTIPIAHPTILPTAHRIGGPIGHGYCGSGTTEGGTLPSYAAEWPHPPSQWPDDEVARRAETEREREKMRLVALQMRISQGDSGSDRGRGAMDPTSRLLYSQHLVGVCELLRRWHRHASIWRAEKMCTVRSRHRRSASAFETWRGRLADESERSFVRFVHVLHRQALHRRRRLHLSTTLHQMRSELTRTGRRLRGEREARRRWVDRRLLCAWTRLVEVAQRSSAHLMPEEVAKYRAHRCRRRGFMRWYHWGLGSLSLPASTHARRSELSRAVRCWRRFRVRISSAEAERALARRCLVELDTRRLIRRWQRNLATQVAELAANAAAKASADDAIEGFQRRHCRSEALRRWRRALSTSRLVTLSRLACSCRLRSYALQRWRRWLRATLAMRARYGLADLMHLRLAARAVLAAFGLAARRALDALARRSRARASLSSRLLNSVSLRISALGRPLVPECARLVKLYCRWSEAIEALAELPEELPGELPLSEAPLLLMHAAFEALEALLLPSLRGRARRAYKLQVQGRPLFERWQAKRLEGTEQKFLGCITEQQFLGCITEQQFLRCITNRI